jgi:hypothetical protein
MGWYEIFATFLHIIKPGVGSKYCAMSSRETIKQSFLSSISLLIDNTIIQVNIYYTIAPYFSQKSLFNV